MRIRGALTRTLAAASLSGGVVGFGLGPPPLRAEPVPVVAAGQAIEMRVTIVHARRTEAQPRVAKELTALARYLVKAFPDYRSFSPLGEHAKRLTEGAEVVWPLPNEVELLVRHAGMRDDAYALRLEVGGLKTTVLVPPGRVFFQAGRTYEDGILVLAFEVGPG